jgi:glycosyltransferase involved in cell wall biosynthesis
VLTLIDKPLAIGGAERLAVDLTIALDPVHFERYFCATRRTVFRQLDVELRAAGVEYLALDRRSRYDVKPWWALLRFIRRERIDVLHTHLLGSNLWGSVIGRLTGVPAVIAHEHTWSYVGRPLRRLADRHIVARFADTIVAVSQADREKMTSVEHIPAGKITVIRNGIHDPVVTSPRDEVRARLGVASDAFVVAAVAVIRPQKRLDRLIEAAAILRREIPGIQVLVVGAGYPDEQAKLDKLVEARDLGATVRFLGERNDAPNLMAAADIGIITSDYEGIPLSLLEFMALRRPVVATAVGGLPEVLRDGETGTLVRELTPDAVAAAVIALSRLSNERRGEMGDAARALQQETYSFDAYVRSVEELYERLLSRDRMD